MTAVIVTGGKQYKVREGDIIYTEKLPVADGDTVKFDQIIAVFDGDKIKLGNPTVTGVTVMGKAIKTGKAKKIVVFKMKAKKNYRRTQGHRQSYTKIQIDSIAIAQ